MHELKRERWGQLKKKISKAKFENKLEIKLINDEIMASLKSDD